MQKDRSGQKSKEICCGKVMGVFRGDSGYGLEESIPV